MTAVFVRIDICLVAIKGQADSPAM